MVLQVTGDMRYDEDNRTWSSFFIADGPYKNKATHMVQNRNFSLCFYVDVPYSAGLIPGIVQYRAIHEFCSILDTYVVHLIFT